MFVIFFHLVSLNVFLFLIIKILDYIIWCVPPNSNILSLQHKHLIGIKTSNTSESKLFLEIFQK